MNKLIFVCLIVVALGFADAFESIQLINVEYIDFYKGRLTIGNNPIEQQTCEDEDERLCAFYMPDEIRCYNRGYLNGQVSGEWGCMGRLNRSITFKKFKVSCEPYPGSTPEQKLVIRGSCSLRYTLASK